MLQISKQSISQWLLLSYMAEQTYLSDKIVQFGNKYQSSFADFEVQINAATVESFEAWDDYIEWKAYQDFLENIQQKIIEVKNGNFQMVG